MEYKYTVKELPEDERPREKLLKYGAESLSDAELIALIIGTGNKKRTAIELAQDILNAFGGLQALNQIAVEEFTEIKGVGIAKGSQIKAVVELSRRFAFINNQDKNLIERPEDVSNLLMPELRFSSQEIFKIILINMRNQIIAIPCISKGGLTNSVVHPREVFREAIKRSSAAIILVHNHPSGSPDPSQEDINITKRLIKTGKIVGIEVLDHIVIGDGNFISMREKGLI